MEWSVCICSICRLPKGKVADNGNFDPEGLSRTWLTVQGEQLKLGWGVSEFIPSYELGMVLSGDDGIEGHGTARELIETYVEEAMQHLLHIGISLDHDGAEHGYIVISDYYDCMKFD